MVVKQLLKQYCAHSTRLNFASEDVWQMQMLMLLIPECRLVGVSVGLLERDGKHESAFLS